MDKRRIGNIQHLVINHRKKSNRTIWKNPTTTRNKHNNNENHNNHNTDNDAITSRTKGPETITEGKREKQDHI